MQSLSCTKKEEFATTTKNKVKQDAVLKTFWRNNERFADLFNAALFNGEQMIKPEDLTEVDTDLSSIITINGHAETIQRIVDVAKKKAYGINFVIFGLENQDEVHYAMPLRHMMNDALGYFKEYQEIKAKNKKENNTKSSAEFLSGLKKTDRLHPVISICVYYGDTEWDGPRSLTDMLEIPEELKPVVADYKMNLVQVISSGDMNFQNQDVITTFDMIRMIYNKDHQKLQTFYKDKTMDPELVLVVGAVTESQRLIDQALKEKEGGGEMSMCRALVEWEQENIEKGIASGKKELLKEQVKKKLTKGKSIEVIADELEEEVPVIQTIIDELNNEK